MTAKPIWTIAKVLDWTKQYFAEKGLENPRLDAEILLRFKVPAYNFICAF